MRLLTDPVKPPATLAYSETTAAHLRRARAILRDGFRHVARLYLILLTIESEQDGRVDDANAYRGMRRSYGFMGRLQTTPDDALKAMAMYDMERHESNSTGFVIGKYREPEHNSHVNYPTDNGIVVGVIAQDHGEAWVTAEINFADAIQSRLRPSRLLKTHCKAFEYAGQIITLAQFLMMYSDVPT